MKEVSIRIHAYRNHVYKNCAFKMKRDVLYLPSDVDGDMDISQDLPQTSSESPLGQVASFFEALI